MRAKRNHVWIVELASPDRDDWEPMIHRVFSNKRDAVADAKDDKRQIPSYRYRPKAYYAEETK